MNDELETRLQSIEHEILNIKEKQDDILEALDTLAQAVEAQQGKNR